MVDRGQCRPDYGEPADSFAICMRDKITYVTVSSGVVVAKNKTGFLAVIHATTIDVPI